MAGAAAGVFDQLGSLYGTPEFGGGRLVGTVYRLTFSSFGGARTFPFSFQDHKNQNDGCIPVGRLTFDPVGDLFSSHLTICPNSADEIRW